MVILQDTCTGFVIVRPIDGQKRRGVAALGLYAGAGAIFYTLFTGWIIAGVYSSSSLGICFYSLAAVQFILSCIITYAVSKGKLDAPPLSLREKSIDSKASKKEENLWGEDVARSDETLKDEESNEFSSKGSQCSSLLYDAHLVPEQLSSRSEALKYSAVWLVLLQRGAVAFNGYATKVLLSSMYVLNTCFRPADPPWSNRSFLTVQLR